MTGLLPFDYSDVSANLKQELFDDAEYIRRKQADAQHNVIEAGIRLLAVKEKLPHGAFLPWVEAECGMSERTVRDFMAIAGEFGSNRHRGADLPIRAMRSLASPSMPEDAKKEIYDKIDAGETVTTAEIERAKREALEAAEAAKQAEARAAKVENEKADLLAQISTISQDADERAQSKIAEAESRATAEVQAIKAKMDALEQDAKANDAKIEAAVQSRAKAATEAEIAKHETELRELRRKQRETKSDLERLENSVEKTRNFLEEVDAKRRRVAEAEEEAKYLEADLKEISTAINSVANEVQGLEHGHEGSVVKLAHVVADQCEGLAMMLRGIQKRANVIELEAV